MAEEGKGEAEAEEDKNAVVSSEEALVAEGCGGSAKAILRRVLYNDDDDDDDEEEVTSIPSIITSAPPLTLPCQTCETQKIALQEALKEEEENDDQATLDSDLSLPHRKIFVVTTAALPWRTGTSVNPLLRALYLTRNRPRAGYVTLVVPWLANKQDRDVLYGENSARLFEGKGGKERQAQWMRDYAKERCGMEKEANNLNILFYPAVYNQAFGSIFASQDICSLIPDDQADVAILEEPEHLNWFRVPTNEPTLTTTHSAAENDGDDNDDNTPTDNNQNNTNNNNNNNNNNNHIQRQTLGWAHKFKFVVGIIHTNYAAYMKTYGIGTSIIAAPAISAYSALVIRAYCHKVIKLSAVLPSFAPGKEVTCNVHGVRQEFIQSYDHDDHDDDDHVKGVDTPPQNKNSHDNNYADVYFIGKLLWAKGFDQLLQIQDKYRQLNHHHHHQKKQTYFPIDVYGTGPDETAIQRAFHGRNYSEKTKSNEKKKKKQKKKNETDRSVSNVSECSSSFNATSTTNTTDELSNKNDNNNNNNNKTVISEVFANPKSLRKWTSDFLKEKQRIQEEDDTKQQHRQQQQQEYLHTQHHDSPKNNNMYDNDVNARLYKNHGFEVTTTIMLPSDDDNEKQTKDSSNGTEEVSTTTAKTATTTTNLHQNVTYVTELRTTQDSDNPLDILGDLGGKSVGTGIKTSQAVYTVADSTVKAVLAMSFSKAVATKRSIHKEQKEEETEEEEKKSDASTSSTSTTPSYVFDPPQSRFEWRRTPVPARFLGVKDHAMLKNTPHKIFLNPSISEVLCTTTAEALAMGKFVIIPKHPSNEFFLQFPNCLSYDSTEECVEKLEYAMSHDPKRLTKEQAYAFTWEAATERLIESSVVTRREAMERDIGGMDKNDERVAWIHAETGKKGRFLKMLFQRDDDGDCGGGTTPEEGGAGEDDDGCTKK